MNTQLKIAIGVALLAVVCLIVDRVMFNTQIGETTVVRQTLLTPLGMFLLAAAALSGFFGMITAREKKAHRKKRR